MNTRQNLVPSTAPDTQWFARATVTQASPLQVRIDGDTTALPITPDTTVAGLAVGARVRVMVDGTRLEVTGLYGGSKRGWLDVTDYGVKNDGTTDDSAAWTAAIAALPAGRGGTLFLPRGAGSVVNGSAILNFSMHANITLLGEAGSSVGGIYTNSSGNVASKIIATGVGAGSVLKMDGGFGLTIQNIGIVVSDSAFTGRILDLRQVAAASVTGKITINNCYLAGDTTTRSGFAIDLDKTVTTVISHSTIVDSYYGVTGMAATGSFSNVVTIEETYFQNNRGAHIRNPGQSWLLKNNTYEAMSTGQAGAVFQDPGFTCEGLAIVGGWLGDITSTTPSIHFNFTGTVYGLDISGAFIGGTTYATGVYVAAGSGIDIHGNSFHQLGTAVSAGSAVRGIVGSNAYVGMSGINVTATGMAVTDAASSTYTPAWTGATTNPAIGNGTITGTWKRTPGKMIDAELYLSAGSTTTFGTGVYSLSLPVAAKSGQVLLGTAYALNSTVNFPTGVAVAGSSTTVQVTFHQAGSSWQPTQPWTFKSGDYLRVRVRYEEA